MNGPLRTILCTGGLLVATWMTASVHRPVDQSIGMSPSAPNNPGLHITPGDTSSYQPATPIAADTPTCADRLFFQYEYAVGAPFEARAAISHAHDLVADSFFASSLCSAVPVKVFVDWTDFGGSAIATGAANYLWKDFPGAPMPQTWYPDALADALRGVDINPGQPDLVIRIDNRTNWYFGTDARPPVGTVDLVTVVLHETLHGLGVSGSAFINAAGQGQWGLLKEGIVYPESYDRFILTGAGNALIGNGNPSTEAARDLASDNLFFAAAASNIAKEPPDVRIAPEISARAKLYAPNPFEPGASYSHLDEATYPRGTPNSLMTPMVQAAEANHNIGPIVLGMLADLGWADRPGASAVEVTAINDAGPGQASGPYSFTLRTLGCAGAPAAPAVSGGIVNGTASLSWPQVAGATSYTVSAGSLPGGTNYLPSSNLGSNNTVSARGLPPGFEAYVRVIANNACGSSAPTDSLVR